MVCEAARLTGPRCAAPEQPIHDRLHRDWQHLHFFQYRALIHAELPRVRCGVCGERGNREVQQVPVPWARERSAFLNAIDAVLTASALIGPVTNWSINSLGMRGSTAVAFAAFFVLLGIHAPVRHGMPHTQNF